MNDKQFSENEIKLTDRGTLTPKDAGITFSLTPIIMLAASIVFTAALSIIAAAKGQSTSEFLAEAENTFLYNAVSFSLSSLALVLTVAASSFLVKKRPFAPVAYGKFRVKYLFLALAISFGLLFGFSSLNEFFISALEKIGYNKPDMYIPNDSLWQLAVWLLLAAALPAFLEETVFRGYIGGGLKDAGVAFVTLVGGIFFSLFHQNPQQTPYQFVCGAAFFLVAYKCGSVLPCVIMHFINNAAVLVFDFFKIGGFGAGVDAVLTISGVVIFAAAIVYLLFFDKDGTPNRPQGEVKPQAKTFFAFSAVGIAACLFTWILDFVTYGGFNG